MISFITKFLSLMIMFPFLSIILSFLFARFLNTNGRKAIYFAIDIGTTFLLLSVIFISEIIWSIDLTFAYITVLIVLFIFSISMFFVMKQEFHLKKAIKGFWRLTFLFCFFVWFGIGVIGICMSIIEQFT